MKSIKTRNRFFVSAFFFACAVGVCAMSATALTIDVTFQGDFWDGDIGQQRRSAFNRAKLRWEAELQGTVPVKLRAEFRSFGESGLHIAESDSASHSANLSGLPFPGLWFPAALASQLTGISLPAYNAPNPKNNGYHLYCEFNTDVDGMVDGLGHVWGFHYNETPLPDIYHLDFERVCLHEIGHGLGFQVMPQYWTSNEFPSGFPCMYSCNLFSYHYVYYGYFYQMNKTGRNAAMILEEMFWYGPAVRYQELPSQPGNEGVNYNNEVEIYAPLGFQLGATLDHWDISVPCFPDNGYPDPFLMKQLSGPADLASRSKDIDITRYVFYDIWWNLSAFSHAPGRLTYRGSGATKSWAAAQTLTMSNSSTDMLISNISIIGSHASQFQFSSDSTPFVLPYLRSCQVSVAFNPTLPGYKTAMLRIEWSDGSSHLTDVHLEGYALDLDSDDDGLSNYDENSDGTRDLDLNTPGIQNPFDAYSVDSTGPSGSTTADMLPDGFNDLDGDGMTNEDEFIFGYNPIDPDSFGIRTTLDSDGDGMLDTEEMRDLDMSTPGVQTPFDPFIGDSTGSYPNEEIPDGISDGHNDYDGDGMSNAVELHFGLNPLVADTDMQLPISSPKSMGVLALILLLLGHLMLRRGRQRPLLCLVSFPDTKRGRETFSLN